MKQIPEGATHWSSGNGDRNEAYWKPNGDGYDCYCPAWIDARWQGISDELPDYATPIKPQWTGEGPPPAGTVCEFQHHNAPNGIWYPTTIRFSSHAHVIYVDSIHECEACWSASDPCGIDFRPIRTPEQIAAEVRDKAIEDLYFTINWNEGREIWPRIPSGRKADYAKAIDAGYRKFEPADES